MRVVSVLRRISLPGLALMLAGMGLVFLEVQNGLLRNRLGIPGHLASILCGTALSVWGLKEVVATFWPRLATRGHQFRIPREGLIYLTMMFILFVGSILARSNLLLLVFSVMAGSFIINGWLTFAMLRSVRLSREHPPRVMAGETFLVPLVLENKNAWLSAWLMTMQDTIRYQGMELSADVLFVRVPPQSHRTGAYQFCPLERGRYEFSHLTVMTQFPLGLVERGIARVAPGELLVYPRLGYLRPAWRRILQHSMELVSNSREKSGTYQDEMNRIREFRPGDDLRRIHWRTTARMNELMVCEYQECRDRDLMVIVDAWQPDPATPRDDEQFERGLRFAATLCMSYLRMSRQSSLMVRLQGKERFDWFGDSGKQHADALLDAFAMLEPARGTNLNLLTEHIRPQQLEACRILLITPRPQQCQAALRSKYPGALTDLQILGTSLSELSEYFTEENQTGPGPSAALSPRSG